MKNLFTILFSVITIFSYSQDIDTPFKKELFPGQEDAFKEASKNYKIGQGKLYKGGKDAYLEALPYFEKAYSFNPNYSYLNYEFGLTLLYSVRKYESLQYFKRSYELNEDVAPDIFLYLGLGYHLNSQWDKAIESFNIVLNDKKLDSEAHMLAEKKIEECENGKELSKRPARVWIDNLGSTINSKYPDFAPVVSADERRLFFTSRRPLDDDENQKKDVFGEFYEDIYYSQRQFDDWSEPKSLRDSINTERHDATIGLSPDGRSLLIYNTDNDKKGDILMSKDVNGVWTSPKVITGNVNTKHHEPSASLTFDEKRLFFVSDMPGGYGMHDIYVSDWDEEKEEWGKPFNLGPRINTEFDERGVFIHPNNKVLYFSSNGHNTIGGLDVFKSNLEDGSWSSPINLKPPINTPDDDVYFTVTGDNRHAYYSSYRPGGLGEKDIYLVTLLGEEKNPLVDDVFLSDNSSKIYAMEGLPSLNDQKAVLFEGVVQKMGSEDPIYTNYTIKNENGDIVYKGRTDSTNGGFVVGLDPNTKYTINIDGVNDLQPLESNMMTANSDGFAVYDEEFDLYGKPEVGSEITYEDVFFDFDKSNLRSEAYAKLDKVVLYMNTNPNVVMEVAGYTDSRGSSSYNKSLSKRRSKAAMKYLIKKGVDSKRLKSVGYGESKPFITDAEINKMNSKSQKEAAHQKNRRTGFKVISN